MATAFGLAGEDFGQMHELRQVEQRDGQVRATAHDPLREGMVVSLGFESRDLRARRGVVTECKPSSDGYRVAIRLDASLVA
ncbi:MAG: hypothetical protein U0572_08170 [Phycisphaerales bacterium]